MHREQRKTRDKRHPSGTTLVRSSFFFFFSHCCFLLKTSIVSTERLLRTGHLSAGQPPMLPAAVPRGRKRERGKWNFRGHHILAARNVKNSSGVWGPCYPRGLILEISLPFGISVFLFVPTCRRSLDPISGIFWHFRVAAVPYLLLVWPLVF